MKGADVGVKARQLRNHFSPYDREALRTAGPVHPAASQGPAPGPAPAARQNGPLLSIEDGVGEGPGVDDANRNENEVKKRRRRPCF